MDEKNSNDHVDSSKGAKLGDKTLMRKILLIVRDSSKGAKTRRRDLDEKNTTNL